MSLNKRLRHDFDECQNCNTSLEKADNFCGVCGQKRTTGRISFRQLILQFFEDTINWDARLFRSIRGMFIPGFLTVQFFKGRHMPFWQPLRLFLFMAALQMLVINITVNKVNEKIVKANDDVKGSMHEYFFYKKLDTLKPYVLLQFQNRRVARAAMDSLMAAYAYPHRFVNVTRTQKEIKIDSIKNVVIEKLEASKKEFDSTDIADGVADIVEGIKDEIGQVNEKDKQGKSLRQDSIEIPYVAVRDGIKPQIEMDTSGENLNRVGWNSDKFDSRNKNKSLFIDKYDFMTLSADSIINKYKIRGFINQVVAKQTIKAFKDGKDGFDFFMSRLSWMIVIMMPIFALFLELVNRPYYYVEHVIFSFHCHAFMFFLISVLFFINHYLIPENLAFLSSPLNLIAFLFLLYYFYKAMRNVYQQGRLKTALKYSFLLVSYFFTMTTAIVLTLIFSFLFF